MPAVDRGRWSLSQLAARVCHRCPYPATLLVTALPAPTIPCYFFYLLMALYALLHAEPPDLLAAEVGLDNRLDIRHAHDHEDTKPPKSSSNLRIR